MIAFRLSVPQKKDDMTNDEVRKIVAGHGLPNDMRIGRNPPQGTKAAYFCENDTMHVTASPNVLSLLHEAAHCEHQGLLGLRGRTMHARIECQVGLALASEVYVGIRLAGVPGFEAQERQALASIPGFPPTFAQFANLCQTRDGFVGRRYDGRNLYTVMAALILMKTLPLLGIETQRPNLTTFAGMTACRGYTGILISAAQRLEMMARNGTALSDWKSIGELGEQFVGQCIQANVSISAITGS